MIENKFKFHTLKINIDKHPSFIKNRLKNLEVDQFGHSAFGLSKTTKDLLRIILKVTKKNLLT